MKITAIDSVVVEHRIRPDRIVVSHAGRHDRSRFLLVRLRDEDGRSGYGEAATTLQWSGEWAEGAQSLLHDVLRPLLLNGSFEHPAEALEIMDRAMYHHGFLKSAVDTALWDLWGKSQGCPVLQLVAERAAPASIPTRSSIGAYDVTDTVRIAEEFWRAGVRILKFKIGLPGLDDAQRLRAVREQLGEDPIFTVDANGAYADALTALRAIANLLPYQVALVEQPTPRERLDQLAAVRRGLAGSVPLMADEAVFKPGDLEAALALEACDVVALYPGKNGGFSHALNMARRCGEVGLRCAIGSNLESELGQAAMATLAAALKVFPIEELPCDLPAELFYEESPLAQPLALERGRFPVPRGEGFGVTPRAGICTGLGE